VAFLTDIEDRSLRITRMILHVVGEGPFAPEQERPVQFAPFFLDRIRDTNVDAVFRFEPDSATRDLLATIASHPEEFEPGAQALSRRFAEMHNARSLEGAFFIFELAVEDPDVRIYSLIKYDYRQAIEQVDAAGESLLRLIEHTFITDRKAIQKAAFVRVVAGVAEAAVAAVDRMKPPPDIGAYFANFLGVTRTRSDLELNREVVEVLRKTLAESEAVLPSRNVALAFRTAKSTLRERQEIDEEAISAAVLAGAGHPEDENTRARLQSGTLQKIRTAKLEGLAFRPDREVLDRPAMRQLRTTEGVTLLYPDILDGELVRRDARRGGGEVITVETEEVTEDRVVRDSPRGAA